MIRPIWLVIAGAGDACPLYLFPRSLYNTKLPKAKSLVGLPNAVFNGVITVNGKDLAIDGWIGNQNYNWGVKHTEAGVSLNFVKGVTSLDFDSRGSFRLAEYAFCGH